MDQVKRTFAVAMVLALSAFGLSSPVTAAPVHTGAPVHAASQPGMGTVEVTVTAWATGAAATAGCVSLHEPGTATAVATQCTGIAGVYVFEDVAPGDYAIRGYNFTGLAALFYGPAATITNAVSVAVSADTTTAINLALPPHYTIVHRLLDAQSQPLVGVSVELFSRTGTYPFRSAVTDANGWVLISSNACTNSCRLRYSDTGSAVSSWFPGVGSYSQSTTFSIGSAYVLVLPDVVLDVGVGSIAATLDRPVYSTDTGDACLILFDNVPVAEVCGEPGEPAKFDRIAEGNYVLCYGTPGDSIHPAVRDCLGDVGRRSIVVVGGEETTVPAGFGSTGLSVSIHDAFSIVDPADGCVRLVRSDTGEVFGPVCEPPSGEYHFELPHVRVPYVVEGYGFEGYIDTYELTSISAVLGEWRTVSHSVERWPRLRVPVWAPTTSTATEYCASAYDHKGEPATTACVPAVAGLTSDVTLSVPPGIYRVKVFSNDETVAEQWYGGTNFTDAREVEARRGVHNFPTQVATFSLAFGGELGGVVSGSDATPVEGACVEIVSAAGALIRRLCTGADGAWEAPGLPAGKYKVHVIGVAGKASEWVGGEDFDAAQVWEVAAGESISVNVELGASGVVSGVVTTAAGGNAEAGCVTAYEIPAVLLAATTCSTTGGSFALDLPPGEYVLHYVGWTAEGGEPLGEQWSGGSVVAEDAEILLVQAGDSTDGSAALAELGGVVTLNPEVSLVASDETRVAFGGCVDAFDVHGRFASTACDDGSGQVTFHLPSGSYKFYARDFTYSYLPAWGFEGGEYGIAFAGDSWDGGALLFDQSDVTVVSGAGDLSKELSLVQGARMQGELLLNASGYAITRASDGWVVALDPDSETEVARTPIHSGGRYVFANMPVGVEVVFAVEGSTGAPDQFVYTEPTYNPRPLLFEHVPDLGLPEQGFFLRMHARKGGELVGEFLVPDEFAEGIICADLWYPASNEPSLEPAYLDSRCGERGEEFAFEDFPQGEYWLSFSDSADYAVWHSIGEGSPEPLWIASDEPTVVRRVVARDVTETQYIQGAPAEVEISIYPHVDANAEYFVFRPYGSAEWEIVHQPVSVTDGIGVVTLTPSGPGEYRFFFEVPTADRNDVLSSNTLWIGPETARIQVSGPSTGLPGQNAVFNVATNPASTGVAQIWARPYDGYWYKTTRTVNISNGTGSFTMPVPTVPHEYAVEYRFSFSEPFTLYPSTPTVSRIGGATRYDVAVGISQQYFPDGADTVYIATGMNFPDALGAAPAAALRDAPLLLVEPGSIPPGVMAELARLDPDQIIVAGGPASVSPDVLAQLHDYAMIVTRINGPDRYEVSRRVTRDAFGDVGSTVAYIATGATFPDALSASAAAGSLDAPVILLDGQMDTLDAATADLLTDLGVTEIRIAGGPGSVKLGIETALRNLPGVTSVTRLGGADRFVVSGATNRAAFTSSDIVFIASGYTFPDALAGAAVAGALGAPLYVIPTSCIPNYVLDDIVSLGATEVRILGGPGSVTPAAAALTRC